jgi:hypothetical protein
MWRHGFSGAQLRTIARWSSAKLKSILSRTRARNDDYGPAPSPHAAWLIFSTFTPPPSSTITLLSSFTSA